MNNQDLLDIAERDGTSIVEIDCPRCGSMSVMSDSGSCYIGIDRSVTSERLKRVMLAHELGHCVRGAFYNRYSTADNIGRHEYRANKWATQQIVPYDELIAACKRGCAETWQLAEVFGVTEDFIRIAYDVYTRMGYIFT